jgi:hypothetical protein
MFFSLPVRAATLRSLTPTLLVVLSAAAACGQQTEYPIKFDRLPPAGSVIEVASRTEQTGDLGPVLVIQNRWSNPGKYRTVGALVVHVTVGEVDAGGWAKQASLRIVRSEVVSGGRRILPDLPGKVYQLGVSDGKRIYTEPTGTPGEAYLLDPLRACVLDVAVPLRFLQGEAGLDKLCGVAAPQKKGAKWNSDPQVLADGFPYLGARRDRVQGVATLKQIVGQTLTVEASLQMTGLKYELPAGYTRGSDQFQLQYTSALPLDETALPTEQAIVKYTAVNGTSDGRPTAEWMRETGHARYKRLK